jgi:hypothetical protein
MFPLILSSFELIIFNLKTMHNILNLFALSIGNFG